MDAWKPPSAPFTAAHRVPVDPHVVRRVGNDHLREVGPEQQLVRVALQSIAAHQAMSIELPDIAQLADWWHVQRQPAQIIGRIGRHRCRLAIQEEVDLPGREACQLDIEIDLDQLLEVVPE